MASFGIGIGAFADGFMRGVSMGKTLKGLKKENEAEKTFKEMTSAARKEREAQVEAEAARLMGGTNETPPPANAPQIDQAEAPTVGSGPQPSPAQAFPVDMSGNTPPQAAQPVPEAAPAQPERAQPPVHSMGLSQGQPQGRPGAAPPAAIASAGGIGSPGGMTPQQARALAEKSAPSILDIFQKQGVPKIAEMYIEQGDPGKAEAWLTWAETRQSRKAQETWAKAWSATQVGNIEKAADHFFDLYKQMDDNVTLSGKEVVKDKEGNITGFNVKMRDKATGENRAVFVDREQLVNMGLSALSPPQMFEAVWKREEAERKARADAQSEVGKEQLRTQRELLLEGVKQQGRMDLQDRKVQHGIELLRSRGYDEAFITSVIPGLLGVDSSGPYRKGPSPEETAARLHEQRLNNDFQYRRMTPEQQREAIQNDMRMLSEIAQSVQSQRQGGATPAQQAGGATPANPAARGLPVLDQKTGQIIYR